MQHLEAIESVQEVVEHAAHLLPGQGPISVFIHHNTLHAFEHQPFETAVEEAGNVFGCRPFLTEDQYRAEIRRGRIHETDLRAVLAESLGDAGNERLGRFGTRFELRLNILAHGLPDPPAAELIWLMEETDILRRFQAEAPPAARHRVVEGFRRGLARADITPREERDSLTALWSACLARAGELPPAPDAPATATTRPRDRVLRATGFDIDALVNPLLIRLCAAYLDQGLAYWPMPDREAGLFAASLRLLRDAGGSSRDWTTGLASLARQELESGRDGLHSAAHSLQALAIAPADWTRFVGETLLVLRGWAGMIRCLEQRPDLAPAHRLPARLIDYLALRLLMERAAIEFVETRGIAPKKNATPKALPGAEDTESRRLRRAFTMFQLAQLVGRSPREIDALSPGDARAIMDEVDRFGELERCRLLHRAYERRYRAELLDALAVHAAPPNGPVSRPRYQAVFCIDEREESLRRHLEELQPDCETFGIAGFFGIVMAYKGLDDAYPRPLCPVSIRPSHLVVERLDESRGADGRRETWRRTVGRVRRGVQVGSGTFTRGALFSALFGSFAVIPLIARVLFPRTAATWQRRTTHLLAPSSGTRLDLDRPDADPAEDGLFRGFTPEEMTDIVDRVLIEAGMTGRLSECVVMIGHGSASLNNPHESAHDCGACGGGRGGPNARAFARMANDPRVRAALVARGRPIPEATVFVGAEHNTCSDAINYFDTDRIPLDRREAFDAVARDLDQARRRDAHERDRRFAGAEFRESADAALEHVEARTEDLAQTRPEYGHATNAACVIGRRVRTRGLFLDRRAFLTSYDPTDDDPDGHILESVLAAVAPVCAGINLEYYFSFVDPVGYGCGTKLPHNIAAMLGVMDGHSGDLRTGLPWQMVEIHEPVRLLVVVEAEVERIRRVLARLPRVDRLFRNEWMQLAALSPDSAEIQVFDPRIGSFSRYKPESRELAVAATSADWYRGRHDHLCCARIVPENPAEGGRR